MARRDEERERWMGRGEPYGDDERRFRAERGEESARRPRDWRDDDRLHDWRGGGQPERSGEPSARWTRERERETQWSDEDYGRDAEREPARPDFGYGGGYREGGRSERFGAREEEGRYGAGWPGARYGEGRGERGPRGSTTYGPGGERGYEGEYQGQGAGRYGYRYEGEGTGWRGTFGRGEPWERGEEREQGPMARLKEGVRKLTGKGPKGYRRSDERIQEDVSERIARSGVDASGVEVKVASGEVTLTGFVERREDKRLLDDLVDDVFGVEEVHNHLRLSRGDQPGIPLSAGTATTGTGTTMSAQPGGKKPEQGQQPGRR